MKWAPILSVAASILIFSMFVFSKAGRTTRLKHMMPGREVVTANLRGTIVCPDCQVAQESGCENGTFCCNGYVPGMLDNHGELWRIARDEKGLEFGKQMEGLYRQQVVLAGDLIFSTHRVRLNSVQTLKDTLLGSITLEPIPALIGKHLFSNQRKLLARVY